MCSTVRYPRALRFTAENRQLSPSRKAVVRPRVQWAGIPSKYPSTIRAARAIGSSCSPVCLRIVCTQAHQSSPENATSSHKPGYRPKTSQARTALRAVRHRRRGAFGGNSPTPEASLRTPTVQTSPPVSSPIITRFASPAVPTGYLEVTEKTLTVYNIKYTCLSA